MTVPATWGGPSSCGQNEILVPTSDVQSSGWSSSPLWSKINDHSENNSVQMDSTDALDDTCGTEEMDEDFEVHLGNPQGGDPEGSECNDVTFRIRARAVKAGGVGGQVDLTYAIKQGGTTIESVIANDIGTGYSTFSHNLTNAEIDAISNWDDLRFYVRSQACTEELEGDVYCEVAWVELEIIAIF